MTGQCDNCELVIKGKTRAEIAHLRKVHNQMQHGVVAR